MRKRPWHAACFNADMVLRWVMIAVMAAGADIGHPPKPAVRYFPARTFADANRRALLEYLVCPDPPSEKSYETLAGMKPAAWEEFTVRFKEGKAAVWLRWRGADGRFVERSLARALPWAVCEYRSEGILIGSNHDESANALLPPDGAEIEIGVEAKRRR